MAVRLGRKKAEPIIKHIVLRNPETVKPLSITNNPDLSEHWDEWEKKAQIIEIPISEALCAEFLQRWNTDSTADLPQSWLYGPIKRLMSILPWCPDMTVNLPKEPSNTLPEDQFHRLVAVTSELTRVDVKNLTRAMMVNETQRVF